MFKILLLLFAGIAVANAIVCTKDFCNDVCCKKVKCNENQRLEPKGTTCGCCPACITILDEGDSCGTLLLRGGPPPKRECGPGLVCDPNTKTCEYPDCEQ